MGKSRAGANSAAKDISYATSVASPGGRALVRAVENTTGRLRLIRRAKGYESDMAQGASFWQAMAARYGLELECVAGGLDNIPAAGPVIVIANHPFGILDGLMMGHILQARRGEDFRIIANSVFRRAPALDKVILPISFDQTREALSQNIAARKSALDYLGCGGAIGIFPGGTVSTAPRPFGRAMDPAWRNFTAKMVAKSGATVVPVYFNGHNSRMFQVASHIHSTLRLALLIKEFKRRIDRPVQVSIGAPITSERLQEFAGDPRACMDFLRAMTYALGPETVDASVYGYDFEVKRKS